MYRLELYVDGKETSVILESTNQLQFFVNKLFESKTIELDFGKCWLYKNNQLHAIIDNIKKEFRLVSDMVFNDSKTFSIAKKYVNSKTLMDYYKFMVLNWGSIMYLDYGSYDDGSVSDVSNFFKTFDHNAILESTEKLMSEDDDEREEEADWVQEGMSINKHKYLNKIVVDNILGLNFVPLKKELVIYRTWGNEKSSDYVGWLSTLMNNVPYFKGGFFERFVLPVGFPVCETEIDGEEYADDNEIIVRNEDLIQL